MTTREERIVATFVELADTLVAEFDVIDFLHTLAYRIVEIVDVDAVGIMLADEDGLPHPAASSSEEARLIELYVAQNCEGPCLDCFRTGQPISRDGLPAMRAAWPAFTERLEELGFQSAQAVPMRLRNQIIGAVNVFRTRPGQLSPADSRLGQAFADVATVGVIQERAMTASGLLGEQLQTALDSRVLLEQAKGMLAERTGRPVGDAFQMMRRHARGRGERLNDVAARILDGALVDLAGPTRNSNRL
jgi:transcriptional regulator with GAF, ATPase, and Fis domain